MTKFEFKPIETIIIQQIAKCDMETFVEQCVSPEMPQPFWCEGVLFQFWREESLPRTLDLKLDKQTLVWAFLQFTECKEKPKILSRKDTKFEMGIKDVSYNKLFCDLAKWLKEKKLIP